MRGSHVDDRDIGLFAWREGADLVLKVPHSGSVDGGQAQHVPLVQVHQTDVIRDGRADVSYIRLPADQSGLQVRGLLAEPRVAVLPAGHALAGKDTITIADLAGEHLLQDPAAVPEWRDIAAEMRTRRRGSVPVFRTVEEKLEHVAAGRGIVVLPLSTAVFYTRPGVAYSHLSDLPPNQVCLAWDATRRSPLIHDFAAIAEDHPPVPAQAEPDHSPPPAERFGLPGFGLGPDGRVVALS